RQAASEPAQRVRARRALSDHLSQGEVLAAANAAAAIAARLKAQWTHAAVPILAPDDLNNAPNPPAAFVVLELPGAVANRITIGAPGDNIFRETGAFMVHVQVPNADPNRGATARGYADEIAAIFRSQQFSGVTCHGHLTLAEDTAADGNYWGLSLA